VFLAHLRLERHLSPNTLAAYRTDLLHLATFLARSHRSLESVITPPPPIPRQRHTRSGTRLDHASRRCDPYLHRWAADAGRIEHDPSLLLGRPKVANRLPTVLRVGGRRPDGRWHRRIRTAGDRRRLRDGRSSVALRLGLRVSEVPRSRPRGSISRAVGCTWSARGQRRRVPCLRTRSSLSSVAGRVARSRPQSTEALFVNQAQTGRPATFRPWWTVMLVTCCRGVESATHASALIRDTPAGRGRRHPRGSGTAGT
jgi:integrase/recombinase XerD